MEVERIAGEISPRYGLSLVSCSHAGGKGQGRTRPSYIPQSTARVDGNKERAGKIFYCKFREDCMLRFVLCPRRGEHVYFVAG